VKKNRLWIIVIILIAFALRLHQLTYHSLWFDEAVSVHWAKQTVPRILEVGFTLMEDRLPPLYYLTLKGWSALMGFGEFSVRLLSVFWGVLLVPTGCGITRRLLGRRPALATAMLTALNPFLVWYSQEARMYAPAVLFGTLAVWAFLQKIGRPTARARWLFSGLFVLFAAAGLYSHLYAGFLLPMLGLWLIISYPRNGRLWLWFGFAGLLITALFAPIALAIWRFSAEAAPGEPLTGLGQRAWQLLHNFTIWKASLPPALNLAIPLTAALFAGLAAFRRPTASTLPRPRLLITLLLAGPFIIATLLLTRNHLAFFGERYFIVMVPWLLMLMAAGALNLGQWFSERNKILRWLPLLLLVILSALPLPGLWRVEAAKEAWRQSADYLTHRAAPNHGILIHPDWVRYPFQYYYDGPGQTYAAFSNISANTTLDGPLQGVVGQHPVIWLIQSHLDGPDPDHRVEQWFAARYPLVTELYPPGVSLKGFAPGYQLDALPAAVAPADHTFANGLHLLGYQADTDVSATDALFHPPSGWLHVTLYWNAAHPITPTAENVSPYVNLIGPEGVWGASLPRPNDALKLFPPQQWPPGLIIRHDIDVNLNPATPPGQYQLLVGLPNESQEYPLITVQVQP
jgi:hypothetical protein